MPRKKVTHVRMKGPEMKCHHCGLTYSMNLPAPLDVFIAACDAFYKRHKGCKPADQVTGEL